MDVVEDVVVDAPLSWLMRFGRGVDVRLRSLRCRSAGRCREVVLQRFRCSARRGWCSSVAVAGLEQGRVMVLGVGASQASRASTGRGLSKVG